MAGPVYVQDSGIITASSSNTDVTLGSSVTANNTLIAVVFNASSSAARTYSVTDSLGNTWTSKGATGSGAARFVEVFSAHSVASGSTTVTIDQSSTLQSYFVIVLEIGPSIFDVFDSLVNASAVTNHDCAAGAGIDTAANTFLLSGGLLNSSGTTLTANGSATLIASDTTKLAQYRRSDTALTNELSRWTSTTARPDQNFSISFITPSAGGSALPIIMQLLGA